MGINVLESEVVTSSLRTSVVHINEARSHPSWTLSETMDVCVQVDIIHEKRGVCSTSRFRENRDAAKYVRFWVLACEFDWL
jgi:hypothetical protein